MTMATRRNLTNENSIREGNDGRYRWFAVTGSGRIAYSSFPNSFAYEQLAWEDAEWAVGAEITMSFRS